MPLILICILLYPVHTTEYIPDNTLEHYQQLRLQTIQEHSKKMFYINANIYRLTQ